MTKEQLIEAMTLLGFIENTNYSIDDDYNSITMLEFLGNTPNKPSEQDLQDTLDAEAVRIAEIARKAAVQARIDALTDIRQIVQEHIEASGQTIDDNDSINIGLLTTVDKLESADWGMTNVPKPTIDDLETLQAAATTKKTQLETNKTNEAFLAETDWKILRHIREQHLGVTTSMTSAEFDALEQERQDKAKAIVR